MKWKRILSKDIKVHKCIDEEAGKNTSNPNDTTISLLKIPCESNINYSIRCLSHTEYLNHINKTGEFILEKDYQYPININGCLYYPHFKVDLTNN